MPSSGSYTNLHSHQWYLGLPALPQPCQHSGLSLWGIFFGEVFMQLQFAFLLLWVKMSIFSYVYGPSGFPSRRLTSSFLYTPIEHPQRPRYRTGFQSGFVNPRNVCMNEYISHWIHGHAVGAISIRYDSSLQQHKVSLQGRYKSNMYVCSEITCHILRVNNYLP